MPCNPQTAIRFPKSRGSVLIFVVALLTLIALIGTALVATARIDRITSRSNVDKEAAAASRNQYGEMLRGKIFSAIMRGYGKEVDSARTNSWLGDRLPIPFPASAGQVYSTGPYLNIPAEETPMWRFVSGVIDEYDSDLTNPNYWRPPFQRDPNNPISLYKGPNTAFYKNAVKINSSDLGAALIPASLSLTYPADHPVESIRGKTRTFPAAYFYDLVNNTWAGKHGPHSITNPPHLAADADGDGIADAILFQLSATAVDGVIYYGAIRVIDNNSAINVNTAWSRSADFTNLPLYTDADGLNPLFFASAQHPAGYNNGYFTSNIGLVELLDPSNTYRKYDGVTVEGGGRPARFNELAELDEVRLGYPTEGFDTNDADKGGWFDAFEDYANPGPRTIGDIPTGGRGEMFVSRNNAVPSVKSGAATVTVNNLLVAVEDVSQDPGDYNTPSNQWNPDPNGSLSNDTIGNYQSSNNPNPSTNGNPDSLIRPDFIFTTQNEALATMASRRWESIRYGADILSKLDSTTLKDNTSASTRADLFPTAVPFNIDQNVGTERYNKSRIGNLSQQLHSLFPYRWFDEQEGASLAYRFCLIDPRGNKSTLDEILRHSAYRAAPNWRPSISDSNPSFSFFPANEFQFWFQTLNFDGDITPDAGSGVGDFNYASADPLTPGVTFPPDISYTELRSYTDKSPHGTNALANSNGGKVRFRSVRPLLTTHNPVNTNVLSSAHLHNNDRQFNFSSTNAPFTGINWNGDAGGAVAFERSQVYPGMILNDMANYHGLPSRYRVPEPWDATWQYSLNDLVYDTATRTVWMCIKDTIYSRGVSPSSVGNTPITNPPTPPTNNVNTAAGSTFEYNYWEPQSWVAGNTKTSINTAGFPDLWRAFFNVMTDDAVGGITNTIDINKEVTDFATAAGLAYNTQTDYVGVFATPAADPLASASAPSNVSEASLFRWLDPYRGLRFYIEEAIGREVDSTTGIPGVGLVGADPTFNAARYNVPENPGTTVAPQYEKNTLGMFRSVIRDPRRVRPDAAAGAATVDNPYPTSNLDTFVDAADATRSITNGQEIVDTVRGAVVDTFPLERLTPFQMATLRSAILAFNAQDMMNVHGLRSRLNDPSYDINDVPAKTIVLYDTNREFPNPTPGPGDVAPDPGPDNPKPQYEVTIYANRPQPFITEVFATNDGHAYDYTDEPDVDPDDSNHRARKRYQNAGGYVAIELYNPYPVAITLTGWSITSVDRRSTGGTFGTKIHTLGGPGGTFSVDLSSVTIGANSYVVIDSYNGADPTVLNPIDPWDVGKEPYATREYRAPAAGIFPLTGAASDPTKWTWKTSSGATPDSPSSLNPDNHAAPPLPITGLYSFPALTHFITADDKELIILRPRKVTGGSTALKDMVPVDQFDFTGMPNVATGGDPCQSMHYARQTSGIWTAVYPGRYDGARAAGTDLGPRRHQGTWVTPPATVGGTLTYTPPGRQDPWISPAYTDHTSAFTGVTKASRPFVNAGGSGDNARWGAMTFGRANSNSSGDLSTIRLVTSSGVASQVLSIPLTGYPSAFNPLVPVPVPASGSKLAVPTGQPSNVFPFGGFARNGDILQVPFIAAYRIRKLQTVATADVPANASTSVPGINPGQLDSTVGADDILEMNSISMDAAFAEDTDIANDSLTGETVGYMNPRLGGPYLWANNLFRYLDVRVPADDYLPDTNPATYPPGSPLVNATADPHNLPKPVNNRPGDANLTIDPYATGLNNRDDLRQKFPTDEGAITTQGLININTAPRKVLSMLPLVPDAASGQIDANLTRTAAQDIFNYVTSTGDFKNLFDLTKVNGFSGPTSHIPYSNDATKVGDAYRVYSDPAGGVTQPDSVSGGIKQQYLMMNRISNLVTTKSDTFTVYLLVQGWRNAGTQFPVLDWEQRQAFIVDRSSGTLRITKVPTD